MIKVGRWMLTSLWVGVTFAIFSVSGNDWDSRALLRKEETFSDGDTKAFLNIIKGISCRVIYLLSSYRIIAATSVWSTGDKWKDFSISKVVVNISVCLPYSARYFCFYWCKLALKSGRETMSLFSDVSLLTVSIGFIAVYNDLWDDRSCSFLLWFCWLVF